GGRPGRAGRRPDPAGTGAARLRRGGWRRGFADGSDGAVAVNGGGADAGCADDAATAGGAPGRFVMITTGMVVVPFQGVSILRREPRAVPWAMLSRPFGAKRWHTHGPPAFGFHPALLKSSVVAGLSEAGVPDPGYSPNPQCLFKVSTEHFHP